MSTHDDSKKPANLPPGVADAGEDFGLDAEPGTKGKKASGAGLDASGNAAGVSGNDPDTYRDAPRTGAKTGGAGV